MKRPRAAMKAMAAMAATASPREYALHDSMFVGRKPIP